MSAPVMPKKKCFVIMPFKKPGSKDIWDFIFEFIKIGVEKASCGLYSVERSKTPRGPIPREIYKALDEADLVVADLSFGNPNVFYELGIRNCRKLGTILICQDRKEYVPFDKQSDSSIEYSVFNINSFVEKMKEAIKHVEEKPDFIDSDVGDYLEIDYSSKDIVVDFKKDEIFHHKDSSEIARYGGFTLASLMITNNSNRNTSFINFNLYSDGLPEKLEKTTFFNILERVEGKFPLNLEAGYTTHLSIGFYFSKDVDPPENPGSFIFTIKDGRKRDHIIKIVVDKLANRKQGIGKAYPIIETKKI